ncbi:uncharacterized protein KY384_008511 [Bacidia gigantensis]|uniref:uncharacterized protein n=1 Tax=Bacidia gigantensis TaxID=2732470 RepID=UPI001D039235|nr:uncharacterized protein KY384_008511 [Bacidia gigantensis]KAG8527082.1 hypothetical protein KY384_008511 [Bacidia gigantensis]
MAPMLEATYSHPTDTGFSVSHQKLDFEIDLLSRSLKGRTELTVNPHSKDLKYIQLNCRQCELRKLTVNGKPVPAVTYEDPYKRAKLPWRAGVRQYHMLQDRLDKCMRAQPEEEMIISLPKSLKIEELDPWSDEAQSLLLSKTLGSSTRGSDANAIDLAKDNKTAVEQTARYTPIIVWMEYEIPYLRDGVHFVGFDDGDLRYPHAYTTSSSFPGNAGCLFPCLDDTTARCTWEISIKCAKTIGDAFRLPKPVNGVVNGVRGAHQAKVKERVDSFSDEDKALELTVLCSGEMTDEIVDSSDSKLRTSSFIYSKEISAQHVGFSIGPFDQVDLGSFRRSEEDDRLGPQAVTLHGYCLPRRTSDLRNTCFPISQAIDYFNFLYGSYPFSNYQLCFVDDTPEDVIHTGTLSICSSRLLFGEDVLDPIESVTRQLVHALATQWIGIDIVAKELRDTWAIVGIAYFMTDMFLKKLFGRNDHRYRHKRVSDRVVELDVKRPSLMGMGSLLHIDPSEYEFLALKAPLVGDLSNGALDTAYFIRQCEKLSHTKLDQFFAQWVEGAGCPRFRVTQRFNKKKLVVEMSIQQVQGEKAKDEALDSTTFMRDVKEDQRAIYAGAVPPCFTGPMTIRIHEADGTPYEHIVEIKEPLQRFDIPYNTKYKRLKRNRRHKERTTAAGAEYGADEGGDVLLYSLGDILQAEDDIKNWRLVDWTADDEDKMSQESYEWIRMDADFEWICNMTLMMPGYMWVSQLQQDRDVVAQLESIQFLEKQNGHPLISTFLIRTLMDQRYFHGIRTSAALALPKSARYEMDWVGQFHLEKAFKELFCYADSNMTKPNDFSNRATYLIQCAIPQAMAEVRYENGHSAFTARNWLYEKLKYNDNGDNEYSDSHYIALLVRSLSRAMSTKPPPRIEQEAFDLSVGIGEEDNMAFHEGCLEQIDRYRRMDEWIPSHQNIISRATLDAKYTLIKSGAVKLQPLDFLQYTSPITSEHLRLHAFSHIMSLGQIHHLAILRWFLSTLATDPSPRIRDHLILILNKTFGSVAIGEAFLPIQDVAATEDKPDPPENGGLTIETEASTSEHATKKARKTTMSGALEALRQELGSNPVLSDGLWAAISSPTISLRQVWQLLEICGRLYIPRTSILVVLKYPRYWSCEKTGKGKVVFKRTDRVRTKMLPKKAVKLKFTAGGGSAAGGAAKTGSPAPSALPSTPGVRREGSFGGGGNRAPIMGAPRPLLKPPKPPPGTVQQQAPVQRPPLQKIASSSSVDSAPGNGGVEGGEEPKKKLTIKLKIGSGTGRAGSPQS